ncbi:T9SS C-terminal target domain-containing protein [Flavobacterium pectinovorum]|uniref:T9SS C-terminal target domain-containing protein n=2 Tax=Flavobacterium pectinovorum TaxID=29533 RepID=A0A502F775_9FLAO|nr:T9SS C-terminal target domain-containing protein [Flavobacterium pectinovorum]
MLRFYLRILINTKNLQMKKKLLLIFAITFLCNNAFAQKGLIISEILTNPNGDDSPLEYVELVATTTINFATTPYTVVFTDNGTATSNGWKAGSAVTYAFLINSGSVTAGQVVYVGGSSMLPLNQSGVALKTKNTGTTAGDSFGSKNTSGVLGNGGSNADGVAVFNVAASSISSSTVPVDAVFFGDAVGSAFKSSGSGYQLPVNDNYNGGKLQTSSYLAPDPGSDQLVKATAGVYNTTTNTFTTSRSWTLTTTPSYNTTSITIAGTPVGNIAPTITITAPTVSGNAPATVSLSATATDSDGTISKVEFYNGSTLLATVTSTPYSYSWTNVAAGSYSITAKATDNTGASTTSVVQNVTVNAAGSNVAPTITLATPTVSGNAPATVSLAATATDSDGTISKVEFFNGSTLLASIIAAPYSYSWTNVAAGSYSVTAKATDNSGSVTTSSVKTVTVNSSVNVAPTLVFNTTASKFVSLSTTSAKVGCVMNNNTDPFIVSGLDITVTDDNVDALTFSMTSSKTSVVPNANFTVTGTGNARKFRINPTGVGYSTLTLKVTDAQGGNKSITVNVAVSQALATASLKDIYNAGVADGSTAIPIDENYMFAADDETNVIKLFSRNNSGLALYQFDVNSYLNLSGTEVDIEASFRSTTKPNRIYWIGSLSNSKSGEARADRNRIFATDIVGTGANATLVFVGYYSNLRSKLITWGDNNGYNFTAKAATGIEPKRIDGFNIEGLEMGPDGTTLYIGFRAPYVGSGTNKALICPLQNFESWFGNGSPSANPVFGSPIELNLNNHGIRSLGKNASNQYIISAGSYAATGTFELYSWNGQAATAPVLLNANLTNLKPEGIVEVPADISGAFTLDLVSDLGSDIPYNDGLENKDVVEPNHRKFLTSTIAVNAQSTARKASVAEESVSPITENEVIAYPNPFTAILNINFYDLAPQSISVYSQNGTLVKEIYTVTKGLNAFDLSDLKAGIYFITYSGMKKSITVIKH